MRTGPWLKVSSDRLMKSGIEPATSGLYFKWFIYYTTAGPMKACKAKYVTYQIRYISFTKMIWYIIHYFLLQGKHIVKTTKQFNNYIQIYTNEMKIRKSHSPCLCQISFALDLLFQFLIPVLMKMFILSRVMISCINMALRSKSTSYLLKLCNMALFLFIFFLYLDLYYTRRWLMDQLGIFHAHQASMCLDPHQN